MGVTGRNSTYTAAYRVSLKEPFLQVEETIPVRKLTKREDEILEQGGSLEQTREKWSEEEIEATVRAYIEMKEKTAAGEPFTKSSYYQAISDEFPARSPKSFEYRMQNISFVYSLLGRGWLDGLRPMSNVGANVASMIEGKIA